MGKIGRYHVGIDGGNSKTEIAVVNDRLDLIGSRVGPGSSPDKLGLDTSACLLSSQVSELLDDLGIHLDSVESVFAALAGLDLREETDAFTEMFAGRFPLANVEVCNDTVAVLMAGTRGAPGVAVICGAGFNAIASDSEGLTHTFLSLGHVSGDWGGGISLGRDMLWHAARAEDGRGPSTGLMRATLDHFGYDNMSTLCQAVHRGVVSEIELAGLAPALFDTAAAGDRVAQGLVSRLAREVALTVRSLVTRANYSGRGVPVVLAGSILTLSDEEFTNSVRREIVSLVEDAEIMTLDVRPVVGSILGALMMVRGELSELSIDRLLADPRMGLPR